MSESTSDPRLTEALFNLVRQLYGHHMSEDQLTEVRTGVEAVADASEKLRSVKLENGDEPFFVFRPYRGDD